MQSPVPNVYLPKQMPARKLVIIGAILLIVTLFLLNYFKIINLNPLKTPSQTPPTPTDKLTLPCPVAKELCSGAKDIYYGNVFLGIGFTLPQGTIIINSVPGAAFFTATEDKTHEVIMHAKVVVAGKQSFQNYTIIYEMFTPQATGSGVNKTVKEGDTVGLTGVGTFPKKEPYNGINFLLSVLKDGKPYQFKAADLQPI